MKKIIVAAVVVVALAVTYLTYNSQTKITNYPSAGTDIIAFGDSLTFGVGSTQGGGFVRMLSEDLNTHIINLGVSGETTASALGRLGQVSKYKPKVIILLLGGNDFLSHVPEGETFGNLDQIIETIQQTGAVVLLVGMENGPIGNKHKKLFEELAEKRGTAYVPDILGGIFGHSQLMSDSLHPNDEGYRIMADRIKSVLEELL